jgi:hypothetical protein
LGKIPTVNINVPDDRDVALDLTVYYCREGEEGLCLIDDERLIIPFKVRAGAPSEVRIGYAVMPPH